jgi:hypothetical protein
MVTAAAEQGGRSFALARFEPVEDRKMFATVH